MKVSIAFLLVISLIWSNTGCKKDQLTYRSADFNTPVIPAIGNTAPLAYAGEDIFVPGPLNYAQLNGSASDAENNISTVKLPWNCPSLPADALYDYFVMPEPHAFYNGGSLYISYYGSDVADTPNVKIVY